MKVYLITTDKFFVEENIIINALFEEGLDALHLRKPFSEPVLCERLLTLIPEKWHKKIVVHDHFYLKTEFDLKGIHLNERNPQPPANYKGHLSRTCYTLEEVSEWKKKCYYVFLTSVFENVNYENVRKLNDLGFGGVGIMAAVWQNFDFHLSDNFKILIDYFKKIKEAAD